MIPAKDLAPATPSHGRLKTLTLDPGFRGLVWSAGGSSTDFSLPPPPFRGHQLVFAPELPAELSLGGQCARACGSRAHLGALHLAHAQAWSLLCHLGVTDLSNEWPLMANRLHLTFTVSKNQEPNTFLLICWPQLTRKHPNPPASPEEQAGQDPLSGAPSLQGDVWYAHSGPLFPGVINI
ncbi:unnamed protein product [Rangifer tarandus platyrhynchus]|uniref:Uncharacterized protein n=2 Tax=Rangifer tarandus platyrhynchus TaxID=3082113 RepID=A0AC59ZZ52_RANTA|nr:unnamed protein product [Rangifer tarandus platyrhynchus]